MLSAKCNKGCNKTRHAYKSKHCREKKLIEWATSFLLSCLGQSQVGWGTSALDLTSLSKLVMGFITHSDPPRINWQHLLHPVSNTCDEFP